MQVNIRIADNLYKKLRETAKKEHRTITAQLELILLNALDTPKKKIIEEPTMTIDYSNKSMTNSIEREEYGQWK